MPRAHPEQRRREHVGARLAPAAARARIEAAFKPHRPSLVWMLPPVAAIWALAAAYFFLLPPSYHSKWSLILPAANNGSTVTLETIGQTSTSPSHPFGSVSLSPGVIYKEIAGSDQVLDAAANSLGIDPKKFGKPRVNLIDETSLMLFSMSGRTAEEAQTKGKAVMAAFEAQLDTLRKDELDRRALLVSDNLKLYRASLDKVRARMQAFQIKSGLTSVSQFTEASSTAELLRRKLAESRAEQKRLRSTQAALTERVGLSPGLAAAGVRLASDPAFGQLAKVYGEERAELSTAKLRFGIHHPTLGIMTMRVDGVLDKLRELARAQGLDSSVDVRELALVLNTSNQADLFKSIVANESALAGANEAVRALEEELVLVDAKVVAMGQAATKLEALQKDHLVAEAVFTSAAARLDIGRTDIFASYPMVQMLARPGLPEDRSQPRLSYAVAAGVLGTLLILLAWGAAWARSRFRQRR